MRCLPNVRRSYVLLRTQTRQQQQAECFCCAYRRSKVAISPVHGVVSAEQRGGAQAMPILHILEVLPPILPCPIAASCNRAMVVRTTSAMGLVAAPHKQRVIRPVLTSSTDAHLCSQEASKALASGVSASAIWRDGRTVNAAVLALQPPPSDDLAATVPAWAVLADTQTAMQVRIYC